MTNTRFAGFGSPLPLAETRSRRTALATLLGGLPGLLLTARADDAAAKRKKNHGKGKGKRPKRPDCDVCRRGCKFSSVQKAIDAASPGATIRLCAGTFAGPLRIAKDLTLRGAGDSAKGTTLDGRGESRTVTVEEVTVELSGMRITGGDAGSDGDGGGGVFTDRGTLMLSACTVSGNVSAAFGGGIATLGGILTLIDSTVADNEGGNSGGIFCAGGTVLINSIVRDNTSRSQGGGIACTGDPTLLINSTVRNNTAATDGGGIFVFDRTLTLLNSRVEGNTAQNGGGIFLRFGEVTLLQNSVVIGNTPDNCNGNFCG